MDSEARPTDQSESSRSASQNLGSDRAREPTRHRKRSPPSGGWASYRSSLSDLRRPITRLASEPSSAVLAYAAAVLGDQRAPACQEQPSLLTERDVSLTTTPDTEVLTQLIERGAEAAADSKFPKPSIG